MFRRVILLCAAVGLAASVVINPKITSPVAKDIWPVGSLQTVRWNTDKIKDSNARGKLVLGYKSDDKKDPNEHLDLDHPLARDIKLKNGEYKIKVPNVVGRSTYIVVLFGDSGNASQEFTITNPDAHA